MFGSPDDLDGYPLVNWTAERARGKIAQATLISDRLVRLCGFLDSRDGWDH